MSYTNRFPSLRFFLFAKLNSFRPDDPRRHQNEIGNQKKKMVSNGEKKKNDKLYSSTNDF